MTTLISLLQSSHLLPVHETLLVACSGGSDSLALTHALSLVRPGRVMAAVVDHGARPESAMEARAVARQVARWDIPCTVLTPAPEPSGSPEDRLRRQRMGALAAHAQDLGIRRIVLAHHARDQLETVLMRLMRGTGLDGLSGMAPVRRLGDDLLLVRPLLRTPPEVLAAHNREHGLEPWEDPTNCDRAIPRNRVRHEAIPTLASLNPGWPSTLSANVERWREEDAFLDARAREALAGLFPRRMARLIAWPREAFDSLDIVLQRRILRLMAREVGQLEHDLDSARIERMRLDVSPLADVGVGLRIERRHGWIVLAAGTDLEPTEPGLRLCQPDSDQFIPAGRTRARTLRHHLARWRVPWLVQERLWVFATGSLVQAVMGGPSADERQPDLATIPRPEAGWPGEAWFDKGGAPP